MSSEQNAPVTPPSDERVETGPNGVPAALLEILVCPVDHASVESVADGLRCTACGAVYPVEGGIPNMVVDAR